MSLVIVTLDEEIRTAVAILKHSGMAGLACIPVALFAVRDQRLTKESLEVNAVLAGCTSDLLRIIIVAAAVEKVERIAASDD